ncbi:RHO alpha subunit C-terminal catalytic domain-containing protein [Aporhodopirellula rubra]|uniref:RHO alpha subunit C-terminal catalytic domain-containing protein n=1 Tax=Aporhodopirellula rubra TaxID=980271 RepID=UPI0036F1B88F
MVLQVMSVVPTSPTSCRMEVAVFTLRAEKENGVTRQLTKHWGRLKCRVIRRILQEDAALYPGIQLGMQASPFRGTISVREELVHAFQHYIASGCELDSALHFGDTAEGSGVETTDHPEV